MNLLFDLYRNYLNAQNIYLPASIIMFCSLLFHLIASYALVRVAGFSGVIISTNLTNLLAVVSVLAFMHKKKIMPSHSVDGILVNLKEYISIVVPIALPMQVDEFCFAINSLLIGFQKNIAQFGAHVSVANIVGFNYAFPTGLASAMCYLISNAFGDRKLQKGKNYAIAGSINGVLYAFIGIIILVAF